MAIVCLQGIQKAVVKTMLTLKPGLHWKKVLLKIVIYTLQVIGFGDALKQVHG